MAKKSVEEYTSFFKKFFTKWLMDAINLLISHFLGISGGALIVLLIVLGLNAINKFLQIQITITGYVVALAVTIPIAILLIVKRYRPIISERIEAKKWREEFGMLWRWTGGLVEGPNCCLCGSKISLPKDNIESITNTLSGEENLYEFKCPLESCNFVTFNKLSYRDMVDLVKQYFVESNDK